MGDAQTSMPTSIPPFLDKVVEFPTSKVSYVLERPLATYRQCHDGTPAEARMVFTCRRMKSRLASSSPDKTDGESKGEAEFVMKIKVQYVMPMVLSPESSAPITWRPSP
ncbi:hypothetical protein A1O1_03905 [Capronia coronata CBS 617.96]|uniref:Uncharacterized protein n=1 Tax=Capronia coronata CBS 617.96 TaxID=1182541 RepID=W9YNJ0_9EURO|nr:uncharacterized protein A1O1_03905 [Capronia coronata CBS 617.96]EXJ90801.1 hypothetical protein A1O1_03905 [Capronia coronata CBS 617.96]